MDEIEKLPTAYGRGPVVLLEGAWGTAWPLAALTVPLVWGGGFDWAEELWMGATPAPEAKPDGRTLPEGKGTAAEPDAKAVGKPDAKPEGPTPPEGRGAAPTPEPEGIPAGTPEGTPPEGIPDGATPTAEPDGISVAKAAVALVAEAASVTPVIPPVAATEITLEEMASAAVTGQIVVASSTVSVTRIVDTCSGAVEARLVREAELAGQLVTEAAQLRTVRIEVVRTVKVVSSAAAAAVAVLLSWGIAEAGTEAAPEMAAEAATETATEAAPEAETGKIVEVTVSSGSHVSSSSWVEFVVGFAMAAPSALPERSRREA